MTAPLEMLKAYLAANVRYVTDSDLSAAIAAIEERDAEIERMEAEIDKRCCCEFKMPEGTPAGRTCTFHDAQTDQIATLTSQLAEATAQRDTMREALEEIAGPPPNVISWVAVSTWRRDIARRALGAL